MDKKSQKTINTMYIIFNTICISKKMITYEQLLKHKSYSSNFKLSSKRILTKNPNPGIFFFGRGGGGGGGECN